MDEIYYMEEPELYRPYLVLGFDGWPNAASVSTFSIEYPGRQFEGEEIRLDPVGEFLPDVLGPSCGDHQGRKIG